jgi:hypothetical protein
MGCSVWNVVALHEYVLEPSVPNRPPRLYGAVRLPRDDSTVTVPEEDPPLSVQP